MKDKPKIFATPGEKASILISNSLRKKDRMYGILGIVRAEIEHLERVPEEWILENPEYPLQIREVVRFSGRYLGEAKIRLNGDIGQVRLYRETVSMLKKVLNRYDLEEDREIKKIVRSLEFNSNRD